MRTRLALWFAQHARPLPWRQTADPYAIWLSEIILQQTQVVQGIGYYHRFLERWPTLGDLASATEDEVLALWQGLGYYSRGRNLLKAAQAMQAEHGGQVPSTLEEISRLPGIGPYTRAAILSFAFNLPYAAVDGNVYRVLSRLYAIETPIDSPQGKKLFQELADTLLDTNNAGAHNQAMIELGAICCTPRKPDCPTCPLQPYCLAEQAGTQLSYPKKRGRTAVLPRYLHYLYIQLPGTTPMGDTLIRKRGAGDIWQGLYELPLIETPTEAEAEALIQTEPFAQWMQSLSGAIFSPSPIATRQHRLTHRLLHARLYSLQAQDVQLPEDSPYLRIPIEALADYALPALLTKLLGQ